MQLSAQTGESLSVTPLEAEVIYTGMIAAVYVCPSVCIIKNRVEYEGKILAKIMLFNIKDIYCIYKSSCIVCLFISIPGAVSSYECSSLSSITIEGPLRRKTLMKEGKKPTVSELSTFYVVCYNDMLVIPFMIKMMFGLCVEDSCLPPLLINRDYSS